jgi:HEAT repeats
VTPDQPQAKKPRSRKIYILWAIALTLLLALGLFCWLVVVPVWQVRSTHNELRQVSFQERIPSEFRMVVSRLGGGQVATVKLDQYIRSSSSMATRKLEAVVALGYCGRPAVDVLLKIDDSKIHHRIDFRIMSLGLIGPEAEDAVPFLIRTLKGNDRFASSASATALGRIGTPNAVSALLDVLKKKKGSERVWAALGSLQLVSNPEAAQLLSEFADSDCMKKLLEHPERDFRQVAAKALRKIKALQEKR